MSDIIPGTLIDVWLKQLPAHLNEDGFPLMPVLGLHQNGNLTMCVCVDVNPFDVGHKLLADPSIQEVVFAQDRFTKEGQGTKYDDVLTVYWWYRPRDNWGWKFGVVNYDKTTGTIDPIDWDNTFWNDILQAEIEHLHFESKKALDRIIERFDGLEKAVNVLREKGIGENEIEAFRQAVERRTVH